MPPLLPPPFGPLDPEVIIGVFVIGGILAIASYVLIRQAEIIGLQLDILPRPR